MLKKIVVKWSDACDCQHLAQPRLKKDKERICHSLPWEAGLTVAGGRTYQDPVVWERKPKKKNTPTSGI
jgi:hypothetical protein